MQQGVEIYCIMQAEAGVGVVNPKKNNGNGNHNNGSLISNKYHTTNHSQLSEEIDGKSHLQVWRFIDGYTPLDRHFTKNDVTILWTQNYKQPPCLK